jgi:hypothetical protein
MALVDDRKAPDYVPSTNELDQIPDDLLGGPQPPAYLILGTSPYAVTNPPERGDELMYCVKLVCKGKSEKDLADGKVQHKRAMHCVKMWPVGEPEPEDPKTDEELAAEDQPPLFDKDGEIATMGEIADELLGESLADVGTDDDNNVVEFAGRPAFSDGEE